MDETYSLTVEQQKKAAYALNICTVSVSQIVDYNDINILEQEYNAILNNLNLEQIPKDEALLNILKDLLDVITHFKISEMEKDMIEKEYQQKMNNAIWAAVPNFGLVLAGGSPLTMAVSLANQVGIGYMNYRRNKAEYGMDRDKQMWQLKKTAIEQFNFIRKELFDTAWRLADTYKFPDEYRLTEKQIKQYNEILQDPDVLNRYERLETRMEFFEAYPPFWYFIGNAANLIANDRTINLSEGARSSYKAKALYYFNKFESIEQNSLLREDVISASCALEHVDLLLSEQNPDYDEVNKLLTKAARMSGNDYDVLQLCAIAYLKIGNSENAVRILKRLVSENYNKTVNAQLLSAIYVHSINFYQADYELLATRVNPQYLFPMPIDGNQDIKLLESEFEHKQRDLVKQEIQIMLANYMRKYTIKWNKILSIFDNNAVYPDSFFEGTEIAKSRRQEEAGRVFSVLSLKQKYQDNLQSVSYELSIKDILNELFDGLFSFRMFSNEGIQRTIEGSIKQKVVENKDTFSEIQKAITDKTFQMSNYNAAQYVNLKTISEDAINKITSYALAEINKADAGRIAEIESDIVSFCTKAGIDTPEATINRKDGKTKDKDHDRFGADLFGHDAVVAKKNAEFIKEMALFVKDQSTSIIVNDPSKIEVLNRGDAKFSSYFKDTAFRGDGTIESHALLIIHDLKASDHDLLFTVDGIISVKGGRVKCLTQYRNVKLYNESLKLFNVSFKNKAIDIPSVYNLIDKLGSRFIRNVDEYIEQIQGTVSAAVIIKWFKEKPDAMTNKVTRLVVNPTKENLSHLGYFITNELDTKHHLLQCYYDNETGHIYDMRIMKYESINTQLESVILENNGVLKINI